MILAQRVAIVTAAGSGIGRASACILAREGATVVVTDLSLDRAQETTDIIAASGGRAEARAVDVGLESDLRAIVDDTLKAHGRIDILHNHAGVQVEGSLEQVSLEGFDRSFSINVRGALLASRFAMPAMRAQGKGVILNTSSSSGVLYDREMIAYTTTKHAVVAMTRQMAKDYARFGVRVNALCPGWVDTPFNDGFVRQMGGRSDVEKYIRERVPLGRWGTLDEMAEPILFLVSDRSGYMTGHALVVDGGETIP